MRLSTFATRLFRRSHSASKASGNRPYGFTLLELLIVAAIGGGLISGLMFIAIELLGVDRRESALNETQREMQLAMSYMSDELREAVYVYAGPGLVQLLESGGLTLPAGGNRTPILAFWKQEPFPEKARDKCRGGEEDDPGCLNAHSYALIVYALERDNDVNDEWQGLARIRRFAMTEYNQEGNRNTGYENPAISQNNFNDFAAEPWPLANPPLSSAVLVDFVSSEPPERAATCPNESTDPAVPDPYEISPTNAPVRSFYACVSNVNTRPNNQAEIILFLQGNATGRPGAGGEVFSNSRLPALETRVLTRGVLDRGNIN